MPGDWPKDSKSFDVALPEEKLGIVEELEDGFYLTIIEADDAGEETIKVNALKAASLVFAHSVRIYETDEQN